LKREGIIHKLAADTVYCHTASVFPP
jgi:hypothetical protein